MTTKSDCVFCKIVSGDIPADIVYEDDACMAFLDISPIAEGHTIIVLREHHKNLMDVPDEGAAAMILACKRVGRAVTAALNADGFNVFCNNERCAGQVVEHIHMHVVPRREGDGLKLERPQGRYARGRAAEIREQIRMDVNVTG